MPRYKIAFGIGDETLPETQMIVDTHEWDASSREDRTPMNFLGLDHPNCRCVLILQSRALVVRHSFANPWWWGWHRFLWWERTRRGLAY